MGKSYVLMQFLKMAVQAVALPFVYRINCRQKMEDRLVVFADAHHTELPVSMLELHLAVESAGYRTEDFIVDFQKMGFLRLAFVMARFMKLYAKAHYVVLCDNFLPVASCRKNPRTKVIQLWHAGGILKKYAYDTPDDIPSYYKGNVFANYDLITTSAAICNPVYRRAMRQPDGVVAELGVSRTDCYFKESYVTSCQEKFRQRHPEAQGKKTVLYAPTFRGKANAPRRVDTDMLHLLERQLGEGWHVLLKAHPHADAKCRQSTTDLAAEELFPVIDCLITDYSSTLFDYSIQKKPLVLYVPDLEEFMETRGSYIDFEEIPAVTVREKEELGRAVEEACASFDPWEMDKFYRTYMGRCDGHATERILEWMRQGEATN